MATTELWNANHLKYSQTDWIDKPSLFAQFVSEYLPTSGRLVELGTGQGQDARYFAKLGYPVTALDFSPTALQLARKKSTGSAGTINFINHDISKPLPFANESCKIVYSHLAIHYFSEYDTNKLFAEIYRILKKDGVVALLTNSVNDPEYGQGTLLEQDFFEFPGHFTKRFFSVNSIQAYAQDFEPIVCDQLGETYKDTAMDVHNLIRFIGRKR